MLRFLILLILSSSLSAKVYDCFLFFNELELLELRFNELDPVVDYFVIVESKETFQGKEKPLYFLENTYRFEPFKNKIIHIVTEKNVEQNPWAKERLQRNAIMQGLTSCNKNDLIFISDVDEIIRAEKVAAICRELRSEKTVALSMPLYRFYMNAFDYIWTKARATTYQYLLTTSPEKLRNTKMNKTIDDAGWHFTSIGGLANHRYKTESFSHAERNNETYKSKEFVEDWLSRCVIVEIDETFPCFLQNNLPLFEPFLYRVGKQYD